MWPILTYIEYFKGTFFQENRYVRDRSDWNPILTKQGADDNGLSFWCYYIAYTDQHLWIILAESWRFFALWLWQRKDLSSEGSWSLAIDPSRFEILGQWSFSWRSLWALEIDSCTIPYNDHIHWSMDLLDRFKFWGYAIANINNYQSQLDKGPNVLVQHWSLIGRNHTYITEHPYFPSAGMKKVE